jgi:glycosyltransferase involved in cell wall biosynthesis
MKIAMLGTRGIPASYSGFETCVEQLGARLVQRGHHVSVYCRSHHITYPGDTYRGMRLIKFPTIANKYLDTIVHAGISSLHALSQRYDIGLYFIAGNSPTTWIPRLVGTRTILNVDGLDWKREKWPAMAKKYIQFAEYLATKLPNAYITDSHVVQAYYRDHFGDEPPYIPYGSEVEIAPPGEVLSRFGLEPGKCVIVGDAPYAEAYQAQLRALADDDPRIVFTGYVFGHGYHELGSNAAMFVETSGVGGTHPALIEAMAFGNCVLVNDTPENLETIGDAGLAYDGRRGAASLRDLLVRLLGDQNLVERYRLRARQRANDTFSWENVTDSYERLFYQLLHKPLPERLKAISS